MELIGSTALVVIDIQKGEVMGQEACGIPVMGGGAERHARSLEIVQAARAAGIPPIFIQEVHKRTLVDFGRELDGAETIHGLEGDEATSWPRASSRTPTNTSSASAATRRSSAPSWRSS
ncbi:MAG: hypothetical protein ACEQSX_19710 [Baekduiaceae bacterium]